MKQEDLDETKRLRNQRVQERRTAKELNNPGKRLEWARVKLELTQREVADAAGIPRSSYCYREAGSRTDFLEEYLALSVYLNQEWQKKFPGEKPLYLGEQVKSISTEWLMFGRNAVEENAHIILEEYRAHIQELEREHWQNEAELKKQLRMFAEDV